MAQIPYRGNLSASTFPFLTDNFGRSVIIRGQDQNYIPPVAARNDADKDIGIPQVYYCHNVLPTSEGFQSVGYTTRTPALEPTEENFRQVFTLRGANKAKTFFSVTADGRIFTAAAPDYVWADVLVDFGASIAGQRVTTAYIQGTTYIYFANFGCYSYDFDTNTLVEVTLAGLLATEIIGIVAVGGYLVAYSRDAIAWSSTIDPTDFLPSLSTGAGGGTPEGLKDEIVFIAPSTTGMFIFTAANCVPALISGNIRFPFNFREVVNTGGISSQELVSYDSSSNSLWCYTTSGVQRISAQQSETVFPAVTDFISGSKFEDFDESTNTFTTTKLTVPLFKKLTVIADRYWILSYGITELTYALVYDLVLQRWGKLKIPHVDCFEWLVLSANLVEAPKQSIGFLQKDGTIKTANFNYEDELSAGVMLLGKFQISRTRNLTLDSVELESIQPGNAFSLLIQRSINGKTGEYFSPFLATEDGVYRKYNSRVTGLNISLLLKGGFNLSSFVLWMHVDGRR